MSIPATRPTLLDRVDGRDRWVFRPLARSRLTATSLAVLGGAVEALRRRPLMLFAGLLVGLKRPLAGHHPIPARARTGSP